MRCRRRSEMWCAQVARDKSGAEGRESEEEHRGRERKGKERKGEERREEGREERMEHTRLWRRCSGRPLASTMEAAAAVD